MNIKRSPEKRMNSVHEFWKVIDVEAVERAISICKQAYSHTTSSFLSNSPSPCFRSFRHLLPHQNTGICME